MGSGAVKPTQPMVASAALRPGVEIHYSDRPLWDAVEKPTPWKAGLNRRGYRGILVAHGVKGDTR